MGIEDHGQRLAAALRMPEYAALTVGDSGMFGGFHSLFHREILVIARQNLEGVGSVHIEADKVLENIQKPLLFKDALKEGVKLGGLGVLVAAVLGFPFHEAVLAGGDGACPGGEKIAHDADLIVDEQARDLVHIVPQLAISSGGVGLLTGGRFQLHYNQRQTVDEQHHIGTLFAVFNHGPLVDDGEPVILRVLIIHQIN